MNNKKASPQSQIFTLINLHVLIVYFKAQALVAKFGENHNNCKKKHLNKKFRLGIVGEERNKRELLANALHKVKH